MVGMRNFQDTFKTSKRSLISAFSICMTVPLKVRCTGFSPLFILGVKNVREKNQNSIYLVKTKFLILPAEISN